MTKLTKQDVCALRRRAWTTTESYAEMAREYGVSPTAVHNAVTGKSWEDVECQYQPFTRDRGDYKLSPGDVADMMQWRVQGSSYSKIARMSGLSRKSVIETLEDPEDDAQVIFLRTNGFIFTDDPTLHMGTLTVPLAIRILELAYRGMEHKHIALRVGLSKDYVDSIVEGRRGGFKRTLAARFMARKYGVDWE